MRVRYIHCEAARTLCCRQGKGMFRRRRRKGIGMGGMAIILLLSGGGGTAAGWSVQAAYVEQFGFGASASRAVVISSEERRVGKECVRPCISRWSPSH